MPDNDICLLARKVIETECNAFDTGPDIQVDGVDREDITPDTCEDIRERNGWVLERAWDISDKENISISSAMRQSWDEIEAECMEHGVVF